MKAIIPLDYQNAIIHANREAWFNATEIAAIFGKQPYEWLRLPETERYIEALIRREASKQAETGKSRIGKSDFIKAYKGGNDLSKQGTWLHPKLAVAFARWCDVDFAVWCDEQVSNLIKSGNEWQPARREAANGSNILNAIIKASKEAIGKEARIFDYSNEACRINRALTGKWAALNREALTALELKLLTELTAVNTVAIANGKSSTERDAILADAAAKYRAKHQPRIQQAA